MKLTFVIQRYGVEFVGGAERHAREMAIGLVREGHEVRVVSSCAVSYAAWENELAPGWSVDEGVRVLRIPTPGPRDNERFVPLHQQAVDVADIPLWPHGQRTWSRRIGPDIRSGIAEIVRLAETSDLTIFFGYLHGQTLELIGEVAPFAPTAIVPTAHPEAAFHLDRVGRALVQADRIMCLAPEEADLVGAVHGLRGRVDVVPCPVAPIAAPRPSEVDAVRRRYDLDGARYLITVGRVDPGKGSDDVLAHVLRHRSTFDADLRLVVVGPGGDDREPVEGVVATGFIDDATKDALVAGAMAQVQPSYLESFSLSLMEGWLLERPALVQARSRVLAGHARRSGGGVGYGSARDFSTAVHAISSRPEFAARLGRAGRAYVEAEFDWRVVADGFVSFAEEAARLGRIRLNRRSYTR